MSILGLKPGSFQEEEGCTRARSVVGSLVVTIVTSDMGSLKKRRKAKISKHKRRKRMKANRHKKRLRYKT